MIYKLLKMLLVFVVAVLTGACAGDTIIHHYATCPEWIEDSEREYRYLKRQGRTAGYNSLINTIEKQREFCKYLERW